MKNIFGIPVTISGKVEPRPSGGDLVSLVIKVGSTTQLIVLDVSGDDLVAWCDDHKHPYTDMRHCMPPIEYFMHIVSGDVQSRGEWIADFEASTTDDSTWSKWSADLEPYALNTFCDHAGIDCPVEGMPHADLSAAADKAGIDHGNY